MASGTKELNFEFYLILTNLKLNSQILDSTGLDSRDRPKAKINKWGCLKLKKLLHSKGNYQQDQRLPDEWEKIFANYVSDRC